MVPLCLEYPDGEEGEEEEAPGPSLGTSSTATTGSKKKSDLKRGQHGRHQISKKKVHAIHKIGPKGEPLEPTIIFGTFSNQRLKVHLPPMWVLVYCRFSPLKVLKELI